jgi:hypothetical protein
VGDRTFFAARLGGGDDTDGEVALAVVDENEEPFSELACEIFKDNEDTDDKDVIENKYDGGGFRPAGLRLRRVFI